MKSSTKNAPKSARDVAYYRQRYRNRFFNKLVSFVTEEAQREHITKKDMAERLGKDPAQLTRLLNNPSNLTLDTVSDILLALDAEPEPPEIRKFSEQRAANYMHPLIAKILNVPEQRPKPTVVSTGGFEATLSSIADRPSFRVYATATSS